MQQHQMQQAAPIAQTQDGTSATIYLVETCIPWEMLALSSCCAPCLFQISMAAASWAQASAQQLNAQQSAAHTLAAQSSAARSSAAQDSTAGSLASRQASAQDSGTCFRAGQHSTAQPSLADQLSPGQAAQEQSKKGPAHSIPSDDAMPTDDTMLCSEAEHAVKQAVQQALQGHAGTQELQFSSSVKVRLIHHCTYTAIAWGMSCLPSSEVNVASVLAVSWACDAFKTKLPYM